MSLRDVVRQEALRLRLMALQARGSGQVTSAFEAQVAQPSQSAAPVQQPTPQLQLQTPILNAWRGGLRAPLRMTAVGLVLSSVQPQPQAQAPKTVRCSICETESPATSKFCAACGGSLPAPRPESASTSSRVAWPWPGCGALNTDRAGPKRLRVKR